MGNMPEWFAKTAEMCASDLYFSDEGTNGDRMLLGQRYLAALRRLQDPDPDHQYFGQSDAMNEAVGNQKLRLTSTKVHDALNSHFRGDWIHANYSPAVPVTDPPGGRYWPEIPSQRVVDVLNAGTKMAILKALGETNLRNMLPEETSQGTTIEERIAELFQPERELGITTTGIRPLATSWNCVAPPGAIFFSALALRGPSIVELAIATPRPVAVSTSGETFERAVRGDLPLNVETEVTIVVD
jgi:hypothetical protein